MGEVNGNLPPTKQDSGQRRSGEGSEFLGERHKMVAYENIGRRDFTKEEGRKARATTGKTEKKADEEQRKSKM